MALSDSQIRKASIKCLENLAQDILAHELPLLPAGTQVFGRDGAFRGETGDEGYWLAALVLTDDKGVIEQIRAILSRYQCERAD